MAGSGATGFPRRLGLFLTSRCDFSCNMCAVQDTRNDGLARGKDLPFDFVERVLAECSPHQPNRHSLCCKFHWTVGMRNHRRLADR